MDVQTTDNLARDGNGSTPGISGRVVRITVFFALAVSALASFAFGGRLWRAVEHGNLPLWAALAAPCGFTLFVCIYAADRWLLVKQHRYPLGRALIQIAFALVFLTLLWPGQVLHFRQFKRAGKIDRVASLLHHSDASVRASMCELAALQSRTDLLPAVRHIAGHDRDAMVRSLCIGAAHQLEDTETHAQPAPPELGGTK
jgi:hypothetical protein